MPRPRVPNREKKLRGTFKRSQALPELVYSAPEAGAPPALNPGQAALDPKGAVAERGRLLMRTETRQASLMITAGSKLGFSPASRRQLGIEIAPAPVERKPDDAWEILKLVPGSKTPLIEDED
jgi:hypothetical protein